MPDTVYQSAHTGAAIDQGISLLSPFGSTFAPETHRLLFRGKNLGSALSDVQRAAIQDGSFSDLWLGDYWIINGHTWRIADFDYWFNCGNPVFTQHHLVLFPDTILASAPMNPSNTTEGGYLGSAMYTSHLAAVRTIASDAFGDALLSHKELLVNSVDANGRPKNAVWTDSSVELPNEFMIYGMPVFSPASVGGDSLPYLFTISKKQLALLSAAPKFIDIGEWYWLRDPISPTRFADVSGNGNTHYYNASTSCGVRPVVCVG